MKACTINLIRTNIKSFIISCFFTQKLLGSGVRTELFFKQLLEDLNQFSTQYPSKHQTMHHFMQI